MPGLWITGIASQYPPYLLGPEKLDEFAKRFFDVEKPGLKKLLQINRTSGIDTRASIGDYKTGFASRPEAPTLADLDKFYRRAGVDLAEAAACADPADVSIAGVLFADGAAAFVLCNDAGLLLPQDGAGDNDDGGRDPDRAEPLFQLLEWDNATIPDTMQHMAFYAEGTGFRTILTRDVPSFTKMAIAPMFSDLLPGFREKTGLESLDVADFDWALHSGGEAIIHGAQEMLDLTSEQLPGRRRCLNDMDILARHYLSYLRYPAIVYEV